MNKKLFTGIVCVLTLTLAMSGCGEVTRSPQPEPCKADNDCADGCKEYDSFDCRFGTCYCNKKTTKEVKCTADAECASGCTGSDTYSCKAGVCYCSKKPVIKEVKCSADKDCTGCAKTDVATCKAGVCYCATIPKKCADVTRDKFVAEMYYLMQYNSCPNSALAAKNICTDVTNKMSACRWTMLAQAKIMGSDINSKGQPTGKCRPNDTMSRAEIAKVIITTIGGLAGYKAPVTETFFDVKKNTWYYDYIEAGVQLGIFVGEKNSKGILTGYFGPIKVADECWIGNVMWRAASNVKTTPTPTTISASVITAHPGGIVVGGATEILSARYLVYGTSKVNPLNTLTVINDLSGPFDKAKDTNVVKSVSVTCSPPSGSGTHTGFSGTLVSGKYQFQNMGCYDLTGKGLTVQLVFNVNYITSGTFTLSGKKVRLGILDSSMKVLGQNKVGTFVIRKSKPQISSVAQISTSMPTMDGDIYRFAVTAMGGDVSFARFVFKLQTKGLSSPPAADIYGFSFRNKTGAINGHHIWGQGTSATGNVAVYLKGAPNGFGLQDANTTTTGVGDSFYHVVVTFNNEVTVAKGSTEVFTLRASIVGATTDDILSVRLVGDGENMEPSISTTYDNDNGFGNTSTVVGYYSKAGDSLFDSTVSSGTNMNEYFADTATGWVKYRNIIWSDRSGGSYASGASGSAVASIHSYPNVKGSSVAGKGYIGASGTLDWTNEYLLGADALNTFIFKK